MTTIRIFALRSFHFLCVLSLWLSLLSVARAADITYVYDELGRLKAVIDPTTEAVVYQYDQVGNLLAITRQSAALVSIIDFTPKSGPIGTQVTIYGTGFNTTISQNTVTFNGVAAIVLSTTPTQIVASVPGGATTGPACRSCPTQGLVFMNSPAR